MDLLVLTRKPGQTLFIGDNIEVKVLEVNGNQVRLGMTAPDEVHILREELRERPVPQKQPQEKLKKRWWGGIR